MDERAKAVLGIFAILTALFVAIIFLFALNHFRFLAQRLPFNASQWQSRSLDERWNPPTRQRMVDDLVTGKRLDRLTREQVEALLGPDDETCIGGSGTCAIDSGPPATCGYSIGNGW